MNNLLKKEDFIILKNNLIKESIEEVINAFGDKFSVKVDDRDEYDDLMAFFQKHNICWADRTEATVLKYESYSYIAFNNGIIKYTLTRGNSRPTNITSYTADEILNHNIEKKPIRWYKNGKFTLDS